MLRPIALALALIAATLAPAMAATGPVTEEEAHAIGVDAYLYFYPILTMDVTRKQLTNEEPKPGGIGGPMNRFANVGAFPLPTCASWSDRISIRSIPAAGSI